MVGVFRRCCAVLTMEGHELNTRGRHLLVEYGGCSPEVLDNLEQIENLMKQAAIESGATIVTSTFHRFMPQGVSGVVVVQESHLSIHTWPEVGYAAVDFYTCGDCVPEEAHRFLFEGLKARDYEIMVVERGIGPIGSSMFQVKHTTTARPVSTEAAGVTPILK